MSHGDVLMNNALAARRGRLDARMLDQLIVIAAQDGELDPVERALLDGLAWPADCRARLAAFFEAADRGDVPNSEVTEMRRRDPRFDARVAALVAHARPGDVIGWASDQPGLPWSLMRAAYGSWMHVSIVLADGRLVDPYWPEGLTLSTPEAAVAKSFARIKASEFMITRPDRPLEQAELAALGAMVARELGKPYSFVAALDRPARAASCSRVAWDFFRELGRDCAPAGVRMYKTAISPGDMLGRPIAHVRVDGSVDLAPAAPVPPAGTIAFLTHRLDDAMAAWPGLMHFMFGFQAPVTRLFMAGMAHLGHETRPGFAPPEAGSVPFAPPTFELAPESRAAL